MFRQKIAEVTNCSCRLLTDDKSDFVVFRAPSHSSKSITKDHKEKYSLKTQTISSGKSDPKVISAKKTVSKISNVSEDPRISISGNIDSKRKKIDRNKVCSPEGITPRNFDQNQTPSGSLSKLQNNFSQGTYVFRTKDQNVFRDERKIRQDVQYCKTFGALKQQAISNENCRPFFKQDPSTQRNKQNITKTGNLKQDQRLNQRADKSLRKIRAIFENELPLRQISSNNNYQIIHGSLEKKDKEMRQFIKAPDTECQLTKRSLSRKNSQLEKHDFTSYSQFSNQQCMLPNRSHLYQQKDKAKLPQTKLSKWNFLDKKISTTNNQTNRVSFIERDPINTERQHLKTQHSQTDQFSNLLNQMKNGSLQKKPTQQSTTSHKTSLSQRSKSKCYKKLNTFDDLMVQNKLCESILGQGEDKENENENSVVVMTFKELIEKVKSQKEDASDSSKKASFIKNPSQNQTHKASVLTNESELHLKFKPYASFFKKQNSGPH